MKRNPILLLLAVVLVGAALWMMQRPAPAPALPDVTRDAPTDVARTQSPASTWPDFLPNEARPVLRRIVDGSAHPHRQDGSTFQNREGRLPRQPRGYYREYTVDTPGLGHRGARRIVTGGQPPAIYYYTDDHYGSFRRFAPPTELAP